MITIVTVGDKYFTLDGIQYPRIYQPLKQGLENIGIFSIFDSRFQLVSSTKYDEYSIDGSTFGTQALTIAAILEVVYIDISNADALGGIVAASYYHTLNANLPTIDWAAKVMTSASHINSGGNVYSEGLFVFGTSVIEGEYIARSGDNVNIYSGGSLVLSVKPTGIQSLGEIKASEYKSSDGTSGVTASISFIDNDGNTIAIESKNGLITTLTKTAP